MHVKFYIPPCGNTIQNRQFRLQKCNQNIASPRADILSLFWFPFPLEEMHNKLCIPASGNTKRTAHICFADMQADVCSTASGTARNSVIFNTWSLGKMSHSGEIGRSSGRKNLGKNLRFCPKSITYFIYILGEKRIHEKNWLLLMMWKHQNLALT